MLVSEVLRERDAQVEYKKRREEGKRAQDEVYVRAQEEVRPGSAILVERSPLTLSPSLPPSLPLSTHTHTHTHTQI